MGCCRRNFNTDEFKAWLSTLHEEQPGTEFCIKEDDQKETYNYLKDNLFGQIVVWNTTPKGSQSQDPFWDQAAQMLLLALIFYLHYEMEDRNQIKELIKSFKRRMFCVCQKEYEVSEDDGERNILLCCSSGLTTAMFAQMLQDFSNNNHLPYHFSATSIYDDDTLSKEYDLVLMAPQVQHYTKSMAAKYHKRFLIMNPVDFAQYNCNNIVSRVQEVFL